MDAGKTELKGMKKNRCLLFASGTGFLSVFLLMNSCAFSSRASRNLLEESMTKGYDIIVVPGVPFENGQWSSTMKGRIYWSKYLYDRGIARNVMYSGSAVYTPYNEAEIMALYAERIGIPGANIFTEKRAEHSTENIYYSYRKARKLGYVPIVYDTLRAMESGMTNPEIDHHKAFESDFVPLPQRENFFKRFRGTRGAYIDTSAYR
ncbi:MAG: YdcF family protein [Bacteroidetes bacterium]|nr:YdcF family protein [Bacteroidota bacterium]